MSGALFDTRPDQLEIRFRILKGHGSHSIGHSSKIEIYLREIAMHKIMF